jgi:hypothetical protein
MAHALEQAVRFSDKVGVEQLRSRPFTFRAPHLDARTVGGWRGEFFNYIKHKTKVLKGGLLYKEVSRVWDSQAYAFFSINYNRTYSYTPWPWLLLQQRLP